MFLLSRTVVSRCRHKKGRCKKRRFQMIGKVISKSNNRRKQTFKSRVVQIKLCKENPGVQLSLYILKLFIFSCQLFCNSRSFSLFHFLLKIIFSYYRYPVKPIGNVIIKTKKIEARYIVASKKISFSDLC